MKKLLILSAIVFFFLPLKAQWDVKHIGSPDLNKIRFYNTNLGIAVGDYGLILRSTDTGNTWQKIAFNPDVYLEDVSFVSDKIIYAVGWVTTYLPLRCFGKLIKSQDGGLNWNIVSTYADKQLYCIFFANADTGLVADYQGIYWTMDGGLSWTTVYSGSDLVISNIQFLDKNNGYSLASNKNGSLLLKTNDIGWNWDELDLSINSDYEAPFYFLDQDYGYSGTRDGLIYHTTDGGLNWRTDTCYKNDWSTKMYSMYFTSRAIGYVVSAWNGIILDEPQLKDPMPYRILKTVDSGRTWKTQVSGRYGLRLYSLYFLNDTIGFVAGGSGLILKTITGGGDTITGDYPWWKFNSIKNESSLKDENILVYPTFFSDQISIEFTKAVGNWIYVSLFNTLGNEIMTEKIPPYQSIYHLRIKNIPKGLYILNLFDQNSNKQFKLIRY